MGTDNYLSYDEFVATFVSYVVYMVELLELPSVDALEVNTSCTIEQEWQNLLDLTLVVGGIRKADLEWTMPSDMRARVAVAVEEQNNE